MQTGRTINDPDRFKLEGGGYYIKSPEEMRKYWDNEVPGAADNTLTIAVEATIGGRFVEFVASAVLGCALASVKSRPASTGSWSAVSSMRSRRFR